jgi:4-hydroxybenzoate polyprenyltransferase
MEYTQILFGTAVITMAVLVPGISLTLAAIPDLKRITWAERIGLGLVFGMLPQLALYFLTRNFHLPVNTYTSTSALIVPTALGIGVWEYRKRLK